MGGIGRQSIAVDRAAIGAIGQGRRLVVEGVEIEPAGRE